jgi:hypothetical protein
MTANPSDDPGLDRLRRDLIDRFRAHPPSSWSGQLLTIVVSAIDLQFGGGAGDDGGRRSLRLVR